ncbi:MAG: nicotinamide mononucleotide transporter [Rhodoglobus sp.]|nr:nicotinamide mononucleotide transporter [Rhodoglobus sp.]
MPDWLLAHWTEIFGFVTGVMCVYFAARRNIWTFPLGIASSLVFLVVFLDYTLYADAGLQVVFVVLGITGWVGWDRARASDQRAATTPMPRSMIPGLVIVGIAVAALLAWVLAAFTDSTTEIPDAATTSASLVAQYMLNRRWIQSWFVWIAVDVAYIGLYAVKGLWITALLYLVFIAVCISGYRTWRAAPHEVASRELETVHG